MKKIFLPLFAALTFFSGSVFSGCVEIPEAILIGATEIPYEKLAMNMFPRNQTAGDTTSQMQDVKSLGINTARVNFWFDTSYMPVSSSSPSFAKFDTVIDAADSAGIELVVILAYVPEWLVGSPGWKSIFINDYVIPVVTRYKGRIKYWEIWNEPDNSKLQFGVLDGSAQNYFDLLKDVSNAIRAIDPSAKIVSAATTSIVLDDLEKFTWLRDLLNLGLATYADILNVHYYSELDIELQVVGGPLVTGSGMTVWVTETGKSGQVSQLTYFKTVMPYIEKSLAPELIFWYCYIEGAIVDQTEPVDSTYGMVTMDGGQRNESDLYTHLKNR